MRSLEKSTASRNLLVLGKFYGGPLDGLEVDIHQALPGWFIPLMDDNGKVVKNAIYSLHSVDDKAIVYVFNCVEKV